MRVCCAQFISWIILLFYFLFVLWSCQWKVQNWRSLTDSEESSLTVRLTWTVFFSFWSLYHFFLFWVIGGICLEGCFVNIDCYMYRQQKNLYNIEFLESSKRGLMPCQYLGNCGCAYFKSIFFVKTFFREMVVRDESGGWFHKQFGEALFSNILILKLPHWLPI